MGNNWLVIIVVIYLIGFTISQLFEVMASDVKSFKGKIKNLSYPPEDGRLTNLLAQYLPIDEKLKRATWLQLLSGIFVWLEPLAVIYFSYVTRFDEARPLLICISTLVFVLLNNVWKAKAFSLRKKIRLTLLLPAQLIPYYAVNLYYTLKDIYELLARAVKKFMTSQINFPLRLGFPEKH
jgi:hypothetical protein